MSIGDTPITFTGNIVADPELRYTAQGTPVLNFRVASTPRRFNKDTKQHEDGEPTFLSCNAWRNLAENGATAFTKGTRVIITGTLQQRSWTTKEGSKRSVYEITVTDMGTSLLYTPTNDTTGAGQAPPQPNPGGFGATDSAPY